MAETTIITGKEYEPDLEKNIKSVLGKRVLAANNEHTGRVKDVICSTNKIEGIIVDGKSFTVFIDFGHIRDLYSKSVFLKIDPIVRYLGMTVFDEEGKRLGKVVELEQEQNTNELKNIIIRKGILSKKQSISVKRIDTDKKNIILKKQ